MDDQEQEPQAEDAIAVREFRAGRRGAFARLVERHQDRIHGLALKMTGSKEDADDVTQDTFARALAKLDGLAEPRYFGTWLYRIALNTAISLLRARAVRPHEAGDPDLLPADPGRPDASPEGAARRRERWELVQAALARLPEPQRVAVVLCDLEGQTYEAIARLLDIPKGTVMSRIHYGRTKLRELLAPHFLEGGAR